MTLLESQTNMFFFFTCRFADQMLWRCSVTHFNCSFCDFNIAYIEKEPSHWAGHLNVIDRILINIIHVRVCLDYLDADFMGIGWSHLHLLDGKRLPRLPGHSCLALDHLRAESSSEWSQWVGWLCAVCVAVCVTAPAGCTVQLNFELSEFVQRPWELFCFNSFNPSELCSVVSGETEWWLVLITVFT